MFRGERYDVSGVGSRKSEADGIVVVVQGEYQSAMKPRVGIDNGRL